MKTGELNIAQVSRLEKLGVNLVYWFGSSAEGLSGPLSDVDVAIHVKDPAILVPEQIGEIYNELYDIFTDVFPGKNVDLVFLQKSNLELRFDVIYYGRILYEASQEERYDFEEKTTLFYADFKPILNEFNRGILARG